MVERGDITVLLEAYREGDRSAFDRLVPLVYDDLRRIARRMMRGPGARHTLSATGVVHEAWVKLADATGASFNDSGHFMAVASRAMRQVLVDYARERSAQKRGGQFRLVELEDVSLDAGAEADWVLAVDQAIDRLAGHSERLAKLVECRFFAGLTEPETARVLGVSERTVQRDWPRARAWLKELLRSGSRDGAP